MEYRKVHTSEINEVAALHNELAYYIQKETKDAYWDFGILSIEDISRHLSEFIGHPEHNLLIAKDDNKIVGFIAGELLHCHLPISSVKKIGYISGAFVLSEFRGKGIMKTLEKLMIDFFRTCSVKYVELNFISNNIIAKNSWRSMGYETFREQARKDILNTEIRH